MNFKIIYIFFTNSCIAEIKNERIDANRIENINALIIDIIKIHS